MKSNEWILSCPIHACWGKGLQHLLGATKRTFSLFYIFWNSDYRQRFPLKSTESSRYRKQRFGVLKFPWSPLHSTRGWTMSNGWIVVSHMNDVICVHSRVLMNVTQMHYKLAQVWMSHVPYEWVMSLMDESCPLWMSHVPYEWVVSLMNQSCPLWTSHVPYEWVMSLTSITQMHYKLAQVWMRPVHTRKMHVMCVNTACPICKRLHWRAHSKCGWVMSQVNESCPRWMSHVPGEWVMSQVNESCPMFICHVPSEWVKSHVTEACPICKRFHWRAHSKCEWVMSQVNESCPTWMGHALFELTHIHPPFIWERIASVDESCSFWAHIHAHTHQIDTFELRS